MKNWLLVCLAAPLLLIRFGQAQSTLNPCTIQEPTGIQRGKPFVLGIAYWPGGTVTDWGNATYGLHPCYDSTQLTPAQVTVAAFNLKVDMMTVLRTSRRAENEAYSKRPGNKPAIMTVVAFAGNYRSEARIVRSEQADLTIGTGVVESQALIIDFDKGKLKSMQWRSMDCIGCPSGGCVQSVPSTSKARSVVSCATISVANCTCALGVSNSTTGATCENPPDQPLACTTGIQVATSGTDKNSVTMRTGVQLQKLGSLSITNLWINSKSKIGSTFTDVKANATGNVFGDNTI